MGPCFGTINWMRDNKTLPTLPDGWLVSEVCGLEVRWVLYDPRAEKVLAFLDDFLPRESYTWGEGKFISDCNDMALPLSKFRNPELFRWKKNGRKPLWDSKFSCQNIYGQPKL